MDPERRGSRVDGACDRRSTAPGRQAADNSSSPNLNAAGFYERNGAHPIGEAPSDAIPGRSVPFYEIKLASYRAAAVSSDDLVRAGEDRGRHGKAERLCGLHLADQLDVVGCWTGNIFWLSALEIFPAYMPIRRPPAVRLGP